MRTNIFSFSLACLHFIVYEIRYLDPACQCVHLFKRMPAILFLCMVLENSFRDAFLHTRICYNTQNGSLSNYIWFIFYAIL